MTKAGMTKAKKPAKEDCNQCPGCRADKLVNAWLIDYWPDEIPINEDAREALWDLVSDAIANG
jgi:hypothetical protein